MSAPATRVTGAQGLKVSQVPLVRVASERSNVWLEVSRPEPASVPQSSVSGTDGSSSRPAGQVDLWPVGAVVSGVTVKVEMFVRPDPLWTVTVLAPLEVVVSSHV